MAKKEDKYIVVKREHLEAHRWFVAFRGGNDGSRGDNRYDFAKAEKNLEGFEEVLKSLEEYSEKPNKYVVINQDEPYADAVWDIIIAFENLKERLPAVDAPPAED